MTATITRSVGIVPKVNGIVVPCWPLPGGGYEGKTRRLDRAVANAAKWLAKTFNRPITIRFNSDQLSGGAWLVDKAHDDASLELGGAIVIPQSAWRRWHRYDTPRPHIDQLWKPTEDCPIRLAVKIHRDFLLGTDLVLGPTDDLYIHHVNQPATAHKFLMRHLNVAKVLQSIPAPQVQGVSAHV
jgi:hypothetical protein